MVQDELADTSSVDLVDPLNLKGSAGFGAVRHIGVSFEAGCNNASGRLTRWGCSHAVSLLSMKIAKISTPGKYTPNVLANT